MTYDIFFHLTMTFVLKVDIDTVEMFLCTENEVLTQILICHGYIVSGSSPLTLEHSWVTGTSQLGYLTCL